MVSGREGEYEIAGLNEGTEPLLRKCLNARGPSSLFSTGELAATATSTWLAIETRSAFFDREDLL